MPPPPPACVRCLPWAARRPRALAHAAVDGRHARRRRALLRVERSEAPAPCRAAVRPGDLVLVKGSRGTRCDVVVDRLVQERG